MTINLSSFQGDYYPFLSWIAGHIPPSGTILECGTLDGHGARALAAHGHRVHTCDPFAGDKSTRTEGNITFTAQSALALPLNLLSDQALIYLDISHNGADEEDFFALLSLSNFRGLLLCDDIDFCPAMEAFWADLPSPKHTIRVGDHRTTLGLLSFSSDYLVAP